MLTPLPPHYYRPVNSQVENLIREDVQADSGIGPVKELGVSTV
jgi:hypothetical protein